MKKLFSVCLVLLLSLFSSSAVASIFSYITKSEGIPTNAYYTFVIERWDPENDFTPNPCYGYSACWISVNHRHFADGYSGQPYRLFNTRVERFKTMKQVQAEILKYTSFPITGVAKHFGPAIRSHQECVGLFYETDRSGFHGRLLPGSLCGVAPPPIGFCQVSEGSVELNYGSIDEAKLEGATRAENINVTCNVDIEIIVTATGPDRGLVPLRSDGSLKAKLLLNEKNGEDGVAVFVPAGGSVPITVKSILQKNGRVEAGPFSGSGAIILAMP
ncbi:MrpH family fimbial adhesin [Photorhabdus luminescens]|uniref:Adhesin n=1 Tax=Photorhabdus luminescens subsp. sonorensis TaxID=1173677 RepID=A0A5C4RK27_PHOLU|nr:adhesin [Photorhabdus luminescens]TNH44169.1 adhesin [Photorhabdus luminescens subsp. sonorensis]